MFCFYCYLLPFFFEVRVVLYKNEIEVLSFNAVSTNRLNWFSEAKLLSSPWTDFKTAISLIHFDITGSHKRYFEITYHYGGYPNDQGWLVVGNGACLWEKHGSSNLSSRDSALLRGDSNDFVTVERHSCNRHQTYQILLHCAGHIAIRRWLNAMGAVVKRRSYVERNYKNGEKTKRCSAPEVKRPKIVGNRNPCSAEN